MEFVYLCFCIFVSSMTGTMGGVLSRDVRETRHPPCFSATEQCSPAINEPITNASLARYLKDLERKIVGAKYAAEDIKPNIEVIWYVVLTEEENLARENAHGMMQTMTGGMSNFCNNTHIVYERLNELVNYIEFLRHYERGIINSENESSMKNDFIDWQDEIYRCMCEMKLILRSLNCEPCSSVPSGHFSDYFQSRATIENRVDQMNAAYWVVLRGISDLTGIQDYLHVAIQHISS